MRSPYSTPMVFHSLPSRFSNSSTSSTPLTGLPHAVRRVSTSRYSLPSTLPVTMIVSRGIWSTYSGPDLMTAAAARATGIAAAPMTSPARRRWWLVLVGGGRRHMVLFGGDGVGDGLEDVPQVLV